MNKNETKVDTHEKRKKRVTTLHRWYTVVSREATKAKDRKDNSTLYGV